MRIFDEKDKEIPTCNISTGDINLHVEDTSFFKESKKESDTYFNISVVLSTITCLFLCIFTLNFSTNAWSLGNIVTFLVMSSASISTVYCLKKWNISSNNVNQMIINGTPCKKEVQVEKEVDGDESKVHVYCTSI